MLNQYFQDIFKTMKVGDVREESYYADLKRLLESYAEKTKKIFFITSLPKKTESGNPDFRVLTAQKELVGYIEAKDPKIENLDSVETSEQLKRYLATFPNIILTNFFEFRLYRNGELVNKVTIGRPFIIHKLKTVPPVENQEKFLEFLEQFFAFSIPKTTTAKTLAIELAKRTRFLRDNVIAEELKEETQEGTQMLEAFYKAFKEHLIASLTLSDFANLFAQTITYGLFVARSRTKEKFSRRLAYDRIPHTIGILREVFSFISSTSLPQTMEWIVDDIAEVLAAADVQKIMLDFYKNGKGRDPIVHFYETFLAEYDPEERERRGVYFTPEPVVSYIVRSVHSILKEKFGEEDGFATPSITVLDPAAGTLTFPVFAIREAIDEYIKKYGDGGVHGLIKDHVLKNFYAFELMMAPYAVGHLKIGFILNEFGYKLSETERFKFFLTNTLEMKEIEALPGVFEQTLAKESREALEVKEKISIMVIMGNPPYSGTSENKGPWILKQIEEYKQVDGKPLGERNSKWLQDDYVKFFRFAQWKIEQTGQGVLGFITNHAWLDNPTFRGMRASFLKTFDEIYILNLHGSLLKREKTPEGEKDENVFDIRPGVAITVGIKNKVGKDKKVFYADLWGLREYKYDWLEKHDAQSTKWQTLNPKIPDYFFVPKEERGREVYDKFWKVTDIFPINGVGITTARDYFVIGDDKNNLINKIRLFKNSKDSDEQLHLLFQINKKKGWSIRKAWSMLQEIADSDLEDYAIPIMYRPFDKKWIFYHDSVVWRTVKKIMQHILQPNLGLISTRFVFRKEYGFHHAFVTQNILDINQIQSPGTAQLFPLYLYNDKHEQILLLPQNQPTTNNKKPNITPELLTTLEKAFHGKPTPEEIFYYIYAVLYSNTYREKYQEFLKSDFPRVPFTKDYKLFQKLAELGQQLVDLHLLRAPALSNLIAKFYGEDSNLVQKREYKEKERRVYINDSQYFEGIESEVWDYYIGGYQVLDKWLKDRKDRMLSSEDVKHYCRIVTALAKTIDIQKKIDELYPKIEKSLIIYFL